MCLLQLRGEYQLNIDVNMMLQMCRCESTKYWCFHKYADLSNICKNSDQYATNSVYNKFFLDLITIPYEATLWHGTEIHIALWIIVWAEACIPGNGQITVKRHR